MRLLALRSIAAAAAALSLVSCAPMAGAGAGVASLPPAPAEAADRTTLDEQGLLGLEIAYKAGRLAAETATDAGFIRGELAVRIAAYDTTAYRALGVARRAYAAGNAASYAQALTEGRAALAELVTLITKRG